MTRDGAFLNVMPPSPQEQEEKACKPKCLEHHPYSQRCHRDSPEDIAPENTVLAETESAVATEEEGLPAERALALHPLEGVGDAGGAVAVAALLAAPVRLQPVRPVPQGTVRVAAARGGSLGREDGRQMVAVGFVGAVGRVAAAAAA